MTDVEVIKKVKNGEVEAFSMLVEKYHRQLLSFIGRLVNDDSIIEDIGQDVFLNIYKGLQNFDETSGVPFSAWLFISARNRVLSEKRRQRRWIMVGLDSATDPVDARLNSIEALTAAEQHQALRDCLAQLPEPYQRTILKSLQGDSVNEIAHLEGISPGTIKSRLFRARTKLKQLIRGYFGDRDYEGI